MDQISWLTLRFKGFGPVSFHRDGGKGWKGAGALYTAVQSAHVPPAACGTYRSSEVNPAHAGASSVEKPWSIKRESGPPKATHGLSTVTLSFGESYTQTPFAMDC